MTISKKSLIGAMITLTVATLVTALIVASLSFQTASEVIRDQSKNRLVSLREAEKELITTYLDNIRKQVITESRSAFVTDAAYVLRSAFNTFTSRDIDQATMRTELQSYYQYEFASRYREKNEGSNETGLSLLNGISDRAAMLQYYFIQDNPNPLGEKDALYELPIGINYSRQHAKFHPRFREFLQAFNYYDIFLIDAKTGEIVYSVFKELDFATSLLDGPYKDSGLAEVFKAVRNASDQDAVAYSPFKSYTPSYEDPAAFIASPVQNENGENIAVLAFQMPIDDLNRLMTHEQEWSSKGLGESGETYLVGEDYTAQSISRFLIEDKENYIDALVASGASQKTVNTIANKDTNIGFQEIRTVGTEAALKGEAGFDIFPDYRNIPVLSAYTPIEFEGTRMALMVEIDEAEAFAFEGRMIASNIWAITLCTLIVVIVVGLVVWRFTNRISAQLNSAVSIARSVAKGETTEISGQDKNDEIGWLMGALDQMQTELIANLERREKEAMRIKMALDVCDTNVMMADADYNIIYMNDAVNEMMSVAESDIRKDLPNFESRNLMGSNIDIFHKNPAHQRSMLERLTDVYRSEIVVGGRTFGLTATPVINAANERLGTVVEWDDRTERLAEEAEKQRKADESLRIKQALDNVSANVMVADANRNIIYANDAVVSTLRNAQNDLRKDLPNFDADTMVGSNIDIFHKNPSHQIKMLDELTSTYSAEIVIGGRTMSLIVNPIIDDSGTRLGNVVEWADRTVEVSVQQELDGIIQAANDGNLRKRISLEGKEGFFAQVGEGLNTLLDKTSDFVGDVGVVFEAMADGDLTRSVTKDYKGEFEEIKANANNSMAKLSEVMNKIQQASSSVRSAANEVAQGSDDLSRRTETQASSLEETASSMEEMTATVKQTSENATQANDLAAVAKSQAQSGGDVVQNAVTAMGEILESSNKINDIIGVIDEIAFQTNLLALNAAVEAARAGEQGRGFAVVAGEVRTLSQRSAAAAKEIKDLIRDSVGKVESGSKLVNQSGETLAEIVKAVEKVAMMIEDVNTAASEQNSGIGQINQAINQMDEMTQQNAALVEQTSAASRAMSQEATSMNSMIAFFKLNAGGVYSGASDTRTTLAPEPLHTAVENNSPAPSSNSAASFSSDDEWEDF